jgi:AhpD family alkylhydroperoxidase
MSCCDDDHGSAGAATGQAGGVSGIQAKFQDFLKASGAPSALDAYTKQAIAIALSVLAKCEPCLRVHVKKAKEKGFSQEEIDEAAWMAISFGGSPTMMFYNRSGKG